MSYKISLTDFVDIVSKSGIIKSNKVKEVITREPYHPAFDFYKILREGIVNFHKTNQDISLLKSIPNKQKDIKKQVTYYKIVQQYISWLGRKNITWFDPPTCQFSHLDIDVTINPELGIEINNQPHLIKLYFKSDPLSKNKIEIITHLMSTALNSKLSRSTIMSVLDINNKKLISPTVPIKGLDGTLLAELAYISALASTINVNVLKKKLL